MRSEECKNNCYTAGTFAAVNIIVSVLSAGVTSVLASHFCNDENKITCGTNGAIIGATVVPVALDLIAATICLARKTKCLDRIPHHRFFHRRENISPVTNLAPHNTYLTESALNAATIELAKVDAAALALAPEILPPPTMQRPLSPIFDLITDTIESSKPSFVSPATAIKHPQHAATSSKIFPISSASSITTIAMPSSPG